MEKKFSQGEWKVELVNQFDDDICIRSCEELVASVYEHPETNKCYANAKLIASAPLLLDALTNILNIMNDSEGVAGYHLNGDIAKWDEFEEIALAEQAIKKATE